MLELAGNAFLVGLIGGLMLVVLVALFKNEPEKKKDKR